MEIMQEVPKLQNARKITIKVSLTTLPLGSPAMQVYLFVPQCLNLSSTLSHDLLMITIQTNSISPEPVARGWLCYSGAHELLSIAAYPEVKSNTIMIQSGSRLLRAPFCSIIVALIARKSHEYGKCSLSLQSVIIIDY